MIDPARQADMLADELISEAAALFVEAIAALSALYSTATDASGEPLAGPIEFVCQLRHDES